MIRGLASYLRLTAKRDGVLVQEDQKTIQLIDLLRADPAFESYFTASTLDYDKQSQAVPFANAPWETMAAA